MQSGYTPNISDIDIDIEPVTFKRDPSQQFKILKKNFQNKLNQMNQSVTIRDIVVCQMKSTAYTNNNQGEFNYTSPYNDEINYLIRIRDTIELIAVIAEEIHKKENFTTDGKIKAENINHITRLSLHEFALYTKDNPLTRDDFKQLLDWIQKIIQRLPENLHLVISSFAVIDIDNSHEFSNNVVYAIGGKDPQLNVLTKISTAINDPVYIKANKLLLNEFNCELIAGNWLSYSSMIKNFNGVIKCKTAGNAEFYTVIEICLDHFRGQGKLSYDKMIDNIRQNTTNELIPEQVSQLVISNSVDIIFRNSLVNHVARIDPNKSYSDYISPEKFIFDNDYHKKIGFDIFAEYPQLTILQINETTLAVTKPPFGPNLTLQLFPKHKLSKPKAFLWQKIDKHNGSLINQYKPNINNSFFSIPTTVNQELNRKILAKFNYELAIAEKKLQKFNANLLQTCHITIYNQIKKHNPLLKQIELIQICNQDVNKLNLNNINFETKALDLLKNLKLESEKYTFGEETKNTIGILTKYLSNQEFLSTQTFEQLKSI